MNSDFGQWTTDRAHAERDDIHSPALHTSWEAFLNGLVHILRRDPVAQSTLDTIAWVGDGVTLLGCANEGL